MRPIFRLIKFLSGCAEFVALAFAAAMYYYAHSELRLDPPVTFELRAGSSLRGVAAQLAAAGIIGRPEPFELMARLRGDSARLKAGNYEFIGPLTPLIADALKDAEETYYPEWIVEAIELAVKNNKRSWKYCEAILKRWKDEGRHGQKDQRNARQSSERYTKSEFANISTDNVAPLLGKPDCPHCGGVGFLRLDVPVGHEKFGRLEPCVCRANEIAANARQR